MGSSLSNDADIVLNMKEVKGWSKTDVSKWLSEYGFEQYTSMCNIWPFNLSLTESFFKNDIDGEALLLLNEDRLIKLGVSIGNATKILERVRIMKEPSEQEEGIVHQSGVVVNPNYFHTATTSETVDTSHIPLHTNGGSSSLAKALNKKQSKNSNDSPRSPPNSQTHKPLPKQEEEKLIQLGMKKLEKLKGLQNLSLEQRKDKARNLVIREALLASYLNSDYVATRKTMINLLETDEPQSGSALNMQSASGLVEGKQIVEDEEDKEHIRNIMKQADVVEETGNSRMQQVQRQDLLSLGVPTPSDISEMGQMTQKSQLAVTNEEFLKVKLVIVEIHNSASQRTFRRVLSPLMDTFNISPQFGLFHSALIVGPWYLEWNDSCLVVPSMTIFEYFDVLTFLQGKCYSGAAVLAADVEKYFKGPQVSIALDRISNVICEWNANYQYSQQKHNCQLFVDELCKALDISLNFNGALGNFLQQLRKTGQCELAYTLTPELQKNLGTQESVKQFKTHKELDEFVTMVREKMPTYFEMDPVGKDDNILLKSYDRAFWLRHFKNKKAEEYAPAHNCPFNNPTVSGSIIDNFFTYRTKKKN